jgi:hypothetical protein
VKIAEVYPGTAARNGLKPGDTILSFDGKSTPTFDSLHSAVQGAGGQADMQYINGDTGEQESVTVSPEDGAIGIAGEDMPLVDSPSGDETLDSASPAADGTAADLADTSWQGGEDLAGFGELSFQFQNDGTAVMVDARSRVRGSWSQDGADVTIRFQNCVYQGRMQGGELSGTAQYLDGDQSWTFRVALQQE